MTDIVRYNESNSLAVTAAPGPAEWRALKEQCEVIYESGMAPRAINSPAKILTIMLKGRELAVPPMQALSHIHVIEGKPTLSAEMMRALVRRAGHKIRFKERTSTKAVVEGTRADDPDAPGTVEFNVDDARAAGLLNKDNWKKYTADMLYARATSALCRTMFDDVLMGASYTPEELGADVDQDGQIINVPTSNDVLEMVRQRVGDAQAVGISVDLDVVADYASRSADHAQAALRRLDEKIAAAVEVFDDADVVDAIADRATVLVPVAAAESVADMDDVLAAMNAAEDAGVPIDAQALLLRATNQPRARPKIVADLQAATEAAQTPAQPSETLPGTDTPAGPVAGDMRSVTSDLSQANAQAWAAPPPVEESPFDDPYTPPHITAAPAPSVAAPAAGGILKSTLSKIAEWRVKVDPAAFAEVMDEFGATNGDPSTLGKIPGVKAASALETLAKAAAK